MRGTCLLYCFVVITLLIGGCAYKTKIHIMKLVCEQVHSQYGHLRQYGSAGVDKPHPPVPHTLCLCGAANQKKAGAMNINSLWAVTRNISVFVSRFLSGSCCCNLFTSDPRAVWSVLSLILCWLRLLVFFSLSAPLCFVYLSSPSLVMLYCRTNTRADLSPCFSPRARALSGTASAV